MLKEFSEHAFDAELRAMEVFQQVRYICPRATRRLQPERLGGINNEDQIFRVRFTAVPDGVRHPSGLPL